ncbi:MAG: hypothetical protein MJ113_04295 [Lachnospiraceae bacterium]|nr:hypothetical protein [Lachnospiraceae bacterium]
MADFENLRKEYKEFIYKSFDIKETEASFDISYNFEIPNLSSFHPTWSFPKKNSSITSDDILLKKLVFHLGLVELVSYYKCTCAENIIIECGTLDEEERAFYKKLYYNGLGEFFYRNNIIVSQDDLFSWKFSSQEKQISGNNSNKEKIFLAASKSEDKKTEALKSATKSEDKKLEALKLRPVVLVPVGGGKDSVVTLEKIKSKAEVVTFSINRSNAIKRCVDAFSEKKDDYVAVRKLDRKIVDLNALGFLNGHTPFSAIVAFSSLIAAYLTNCTYIALSNEASANESSVKGLEVNHQYSKSLEFENDFRNLSRKIQSGIEPEGKTIIEYFSYLRNLSEIMIAKNFSKLEKYHKAFLSCNLGTKNDHWCCECGKCLFVYIILSPFMTKEKLREIFSDNLLEKEALIEDFEKIIGIRDEKPFECVGTREEALSALKYLLDNGREDLLLLQRKDYILKNATDLKELLLKYTEDNNIPDYFKDDLEDVEQRVANK